MVFMLFHFRISENRFILAAKFYIWQVIPLENYLI